MRPSPPQAKPCRAGLYVRRRTQSREIVAVICYRKKRFPSESAAQSVIFALKARGSDVDRLKAYKCEMCSCWHLGHTPAPDKDQASKIERVLMARVRTA